MLIIYRTGLKLLDQRDVFFCTWKGWICLHLKRKEELDVPGYSSRFSLHIVRANLDILSMEHYD